MSREIIFYLVPSKESGVEQKPLKIYTILASSAIGEKFAKYFNSSTPQTLKGSHLIDISEDIDREIKEKTEELDILQSSFREVNNPSGELFTDFLEDVTSISKSIGRLEYARKSLSSITLIFADLWASDFSEIQISYSC